VLFSKSKSKYLLKAYITNVYAQYNVDTYNIESIQKPEETIYNIRLFTKIIRTIWKLIIMTLWPVSILIHITGKFAFMSYQRTNG